MTFEPARVHLTGPPARPGGYNRNAVTKQSVEASVEALNAGGVRYMIAGGLAVVAHGYHDLLQLKGHAGRPTDLDDIRRLEAVHEDPSE